MDSNTVKPWHIFVFLSIFWLVWLYSEVTEYLNRRSIYSEVQDFMHKGDRFTQEEGNQLEREIMLLRNRIDHLENFHHPRYFNEKP